MKIELKKKIQELIDAYHGNAQTHTEALQAAIEPFRNKDIANRYTLEGLHKTIQDEMGSVISSWNNVDKVYNQKLKVLLADAKDQVLPMMVKPAERPADYALKVNNALQFIQIEGKDITDETASNILKDFLGDYDQMKLFKKVISKNVELEDGDGKNTYPLTFGKLNSVQTTMNTFNEINLIADTLFLNARLPGDQIRINGNTYELPMESYEAGQFEAAALNFANVIEGIAEKIEG